MFGLCVITQVTRKVTLLCYRKKENKKSFICRDLFSVSEKKILTWDCPFTVSYVQASHFEWLCSKALMWHTQELVEVQGRNHLKPSKQLLIISCGQSDPLGWLGSFSHLSQPQKSCEPQVSPASALPENNKLQAANKQALSRLLLIIRIIPFFTVLTYYL